MNDLPAVLQYIHKYLLLLGDLACMTYLCNNNSLVIDNFSHPIQSLTNQRIEIPIDNFVHFDQRIDKM